MPLTLNEADAALVAKLFEAADRFEVRQRSGEAFAIGKADICRSIARRTAQYGHFASLRQRSYAEALVRWSLPRAAAEALAGAITSDRNAMERQVAMSSTSVQRIVQLFAAAAVHGMRFPKIRLQRGEWKIRIYPAPSHGRHPGAFYVKATSGTRANLYCGRIVQTGEFLASSNCPLDVLHALREFSENPTGVAQAYGRMTGSCCFCGHELTDGRSVAMGYGPICADHFGLPWGDERAHGVVAIGAVPAQDTLLEAQRRAAQRVPPTDAVRRLRIRHRRAAGEWMPAAPAPVLDDEDEDKHFM